MMRGRTLAIGALSGVAVLMLSVGLARARDEVTIRVAPTYEAQRYYVAPAPVVVTPSPPPVVVVPSPAQERVIIREQYSGPVYSVPPTVYYSAPSSSPVLFGSPGVYVSR